MMKSEVFPYASNNAHESEEKRAGAFDWCWSSSKGLTKLGLSLLIVVIIILVIIVIVIPVVLILKSNSGSNNNNPINSNSSPLTINIPKRLGIYYGWPSLVQGANGNLSAAIATFNQFDLIVFGDGIASPSHGDHNNTQIIIQALTSYRKLTFGYISLGVTTQNLSISQMQTTVNNWTTMGVQGIMWDDAGSDYNVSRSRQNTMISYCHLLNLRVMMNAWNPDDIMSGTPMLLNSEDIYLLESYLISNNLYQNLTQWKIKADKCLSYSNTYGISMACLSTSSNPISSSFSTTQLFSQAWFGTVIYNFNYFQATDSQYSATNNLLYAFNNPISSVGKNWQTNYVQTDSIYHYYRSTDIATLQIYGDGITYGSGNFTPLANG